MLFYSKSMFEKANIIVTQLEMRYDIVQEIARLSKKYNKKLILNPAPGAYIDDEIIKSSYGITPNETELGIIINKELTTIEAYIQGAKELLKIGCQNVIVTLGSQGSLLVNNQTTEIIKAFKVKA